MTKTYAKDICPWRIFCGYAICGLTKEPLTQRDSEKIYMEHSVV